MGSLEVYTCSNSTTKGSEMFCGIDTYDLKTCGWFVAMSASIVVAVAYLSSVASSDTPTFDAVTGMFAVAGAFLSFLEMRYIQKCQRREREFAEREILIATQSHE